MVNPLNQNPCDTFLSDRDYLIHMINHHQVAIDISIDMQKISKSPLIHEILRKLIWILRRMHFTQMQNVVQNFLILPSIKKSFTPLNI